MEEKLFIILRSSRWHPSYVGYKRPQVPRDQKGACR